MAAAKKTPKKGMKKGVSAAKKTTKTAKKSTAAKKTVAKKGVKKVVKKTTTKARKSPAKKTKRATARLFADAPKKVIKLRTTWYRIVTFSVIVLGLMVAGLLSLQPAVLQNLQANLLAELGGEVEAPAPKESGILLARTSGGDNEEKLKGIFQTVFPDITIREVSYQSAEGQKLVQELGATEVPNIFFEKSAFEDESLSEVVKDLFEKHGDHYGLKVSLVNPSHQLHLAGELNKEAAVIIGLQDAPLTLHLYSDPKCQHCRAAEQNLMPAFKQLADRGLLQLVFLDLPQTPESSFHAVALACVATQYPQEYLSFRSEIYGRANLTRAFTNRQLQRLDIDFDQDCDENAARRMLRQRVSRADADGITGVPAVYIGKTDELEAIRVTGSQDFSVYQDVMSELLDQEVSIETEEAKTE